MMMSSSMASTASVSISSKGKKRLLSLFSLVRTTLRGTAILGQRDSAQGKEEIKNERGVLCQINIFYVGEIRDGHEEVKEKRLNTTSSYESDHNDIPRRARKTRCSIFSCIRAWERSTARTRWMARIVSPNKATEKVLLY